MNEAVLNFSEGQFDIASDEGTALAVKIIDFIREKIVQFQVETGHLYNLEATPAEGATHRFAREDKKRFPEIIQAGNPTAPYYTNSSQLPVDFAGDLFEIMSHQEKLQTKYTGGTVLHLYVGERIPDSESCKRLVKKSLSQFRLPYVTVTPTFSICPEHGYIGGEHKFCPTCDSIERKRLFSRYQAEGKELSLESIELEENNRQPCEIWTRVMGYFRPVSQFNAGKKSEYQERVMLKSQELVREVL
jgi:ribonucleoside-triphosphate reductase